MTARPIAALRALLLLALTLFATHAGAQARDVFVRFGDPSEATPSHLCVVALANEQLDAASPKSQPFQGKKVRLEDPRENSGATPAIWQQAGVGIVLDSASAGACQWQAKARGPSNASQSCDFRPDPDAKPGADARDQIGESGACSPTFTMPADETLYCTPNELRSSHESFSVVVLHIKEAVRDVHLVGNHARISIRVRPRLPNQKSTVDVLGGHYQGDLSASSSRQIEGSEQVDLPLVPLCAGVSLHVPDFDCPASATRKSSEVRLLSLRSYGAAPQTLRLTHVPSDFELPVPTSLSGAEIELTACEGEHTFVANWEHLPPPQVHFKPLKFALEWRRHELADVAGCPEVTLPESAVECKLRAREPHHCRYECESSVPIALPTTVRFEQARKPIRGVAKGTLVDDWEARLSRPGEIIEAYLPAERRYVVFKRTWGLERAGRWSDRIRNIEIHTSDGRTHTVQVDIPRLTVPGLQPGDSISYRYLGSRPFKVVYTRVGRGGVVELGDPDDYHQRWFQPGLAAWVGWRYIADAEGPTRWNPAGGLELIVALPGARRYLSSNSWYVEPEIHVGLGLSTQPFESSFVGAGRTDTTWSNVLTLLAPIEVAARTGLGTDEVELGVGLGVLYYQQIFAAERSQLAPGLGFSLPRADLLWHVTSTVTLGLTGRAVWNARHVAVELDAGGLLSREEPVTPLLFFGPIFRFDDVF